MEDTVILTKEIKEKGLYDAFSCVLLSAMAIKDKSRSRAHNSDC